MNCLISKQLVTIILSAVLLSACASNPAPPKLSRGQSVSILSPQLNRLDTRVDSKSEKAGKGVVLGTLGAVGGAALGGITGAVLGMGCGPMFFVCAPLAAAAGVVAGGVGGGAMGVVYGGTGGIAGAKAKQFNEISARLIDADQLAVQLHEQMSASAGRNWILDNNSANTVKPIIKLLHFAQLPKEHLQLVLDAEMEVGFGGRMSKFEFRYTGPSFNVDDWLSEDGKRIQQEIAIAIENVADTLIWQLVPNEDAL